MLRLPSRMPSLQERRSVGSRLGISTENGDPEGAGQTDSLHIVITCISVNASTSAQKEHAHAIHTCLLTYERNEFLSSSIGILFPRARAQISLYPVPVNSECGQLGADGGCPLNKIIYFDSVCRKMM